MNKQVFYGDFFKLTLQVGLPSVLSDFSLYVEKLADDFRQLENEGSFDKEACDKVIENLYKLQTQVDACIDTAKKAEFKE